jgi:hypothetical protein
MLLSTAFEERWQGLPTGWFPQYSSDAYENRVANRFSEGPAKARTAKPGRVRHDLRAHVTLFVLAGRERRRIRP